MKELKQLTRRGLALLLALALCMGMVCTSAMAADDSDTEETVVAGELAEAGASEEGEVVPAEDEGEFVPAEDEFVPAEDEDETVPAEDEDEFVPAEDEDEFVPAEDEGETVPAEDEDEFVPAEDEEETVPAEVQAFLDAVAKIPADINADNAEEAAELLYGEVADAYEMLLGTEYEEREDVQAAVVVMADAIDAVNAMFGMDSESYVETSGPWAGYTPIATVNDLKKIANNMSGKYYLTADINIFSSTQQWTPLGRNGTKNVEFTGILDGNGYSIQQLRANWSEYTNAYGIYVGLFAIIGASGTVQNLNLTVHTVQGYQYVGAVAGQNLGTIQNVTVTTEGTGGVLSYSQSNSGGYAGGIVGRNEGTIYRCSTELTNVGAYNFAGGIAGGNFGTIEQCSANGGVNYDYKSGILSKYNVGGLVGGNVGTIKDCYVGLATSNSIIGGKDYVGGLVGRSWSGTIEKCYVALVVNSGANMFYPSNASNASPFVGNVGTTTFKNNYAVWGNQTGANSVSWTVLSDPAQFPSTATAWDWNNVWAYDASGEYPYPVLSWQNPVPVTYTINWYNEDNNLIESQTVDAGTVPTPPAGYTLPGNYVWSPDVAAATKDQDYKAVPTYEITWFNLDGSVLKTERIKEGATPTAPACPAGYVWMPAIGPATADCEYHPGEEPEKPAPTEPSNFNQEHWVVVPATNDSADAAELEFEYTYNDSTYFPVRNVQVIYNNTEGNATVDAKMTNNNKRVAVDVTGVNEADDLVAYVSYQYLWLDNSGRLYWKNQTEKINIEVYAPETIDLKVGERASFWYKDLGLTSEREEFSVCHHAHLTGVATPYGYTLTAEGVPADHVAKARVKYGHYSYMPNGDAGRIHAYVDVVYVNVEDEEVEPPTLTGDYLHAAKTGTGIAAGTSAKPGDVLTWTIEIKNDADTVRPVVVTDTIDGVELWYDAGHTRKFADDNKVHVPANGAVTLYATYTVKEDDVGKTIVNEVQVKDVENSELNGTATGTAHGVLITESGTFTNPSLTGLEKVRIYKDENGALPADFQDIPEDLRNMEGVNYARNVLFVGNNAPSVTLLYKITVTGTEGAKYKVTDEGAVWVVGGGEHETKDGVLTVTGAIGESGTAVIYVTRTFTRDDIKEGKLTNDAKLESNDPVSDTKPSGTVGPDNGDASGEADAGKKHTVTINFKKDDDGTELKDSETYEVEDGGSVNCPIPGLERPAVFAMSAESAEVTVIDIPQRLGENNEYVLDMPRSIDGLTELANAKNITADVVADIYYALDVKGTLGVDAEGNPTDTYDNVPDKYQAKVVYTAGEGGSQNGEDAYVTFGDDPATLTTSGTITIADVLATASKDFHFVNWTATGHEGWSYTPTEEAELNTSINAMGNAVYTFIANFAHDDVTVTIDPNNGVDLVETKNVKYNGDFEVPAAPTTAPTGKHFTGWKDKDGNAYDPEDKITSVTADLTLTAQWEANDHTLTYLPNGGTLPEGMKNPVDVKYDQKISVIAAPTAPEGKEFIGWKDKAGDKTYQPGDEITITGNLTLEAQWRDIMCTVTYDPNDGTQPEDMTSYTEKYGTEITIDKAPKAPDGKVFEYWQGSDGENYQPGDKLELKADLKLTAKWENEYTVTFDPDNGSVVSAQSVKNGGKATEPKPAPAKTGYTFDGWYQGETKYDFETPVTGNVDLVAKWTANDHTLTYVPNGGALPADMVNPVDVKYDQVITVAAAPTAPTGKHFTGWKDEANDKTYQPDAKVTIKGDLVLTAQWEDHDWNRKDADEWVTVPTCEEDGTATYVCSCGAEKTETVAHSKLNHDWGEWKDNGDGTHSQACNRNENHVNSEKLAHTYGDWTTTKEPTETESGQEQRSCTVCGHTETNVIPPKDPTPTPTPTPTVPVVSEIVVTPKPTPSETPAPVESKEPTSSQEPAPSEEPVPSQKPTPSEEPAPVESDDPGEEIDEPDTPLAELPDEPEQSEQPAPVESEEPDEDIDDPQPPMAELPEEPAEDIDDPQPPMAELPDEPEQSIPPADGGLSDEDIDDPQLPMGDAPQTGDDLGVWLAAAAVSGAGLVGVIGATRKRKEDEEA